MVAKDRPPCPRGTGNAPPDPSAAAGLDALLDALPPARHAERRPVLRLAPGCPPAVAAERLVVSHRTLAAALGSAGKDEDLLRYAADRVAAGLPHSVLMSGAAGAPLGRVPPRVPVLLPLPLWPPPVPAPRPGLIGVLPLAAASAAGVSLAERRAELSALGWRLGVGELDAVALGFVALAALRSAADLLLLRWSPLLGRGQDALRGADPQALVLTGCDGPDALEWGRNAGLVLFSGPGAEAMLPPPAEAGP